LEIFFSRHLPIGVVFHTEERLQHITSASIQKNQKIRIYD